MSESNQMPGAAPPPQRDPFDDLPDTLFDPGENDRRADRRLAAIVVVAGGAILAMAVAVVALWSPTPPAAPSTAPTPVQAEAAPTPQPAPVQPASAPEAVVRIGGLKNEAERPPERAADPAGLLRVLRSTLEENAASETERAWRFEQAVHSLADSWAFFDRATVEEGNRLIAQHVLLASRWPGGADAPLAAVGKGLERLASGARAAAHEIWPAAWSAGAMSEIAALPDASAAIRGRAQAALGAARLPDSGGFWTGARAALTLLPSRIAGLGETSGDVGGAGAWRRWSQAAESAWSDDRPAQERAVLRAVGDLLAAASTRPSDPQTRSIILAMLAPLDWSEQGAARAAVVSWLDDKDRIGPRELAAVTQWMVSGAPAASIGVDHVLPAQADDEARARLRDNLAARWALKSPAMAADAHRAWIAAARSALSLGAQGGPDAFARAAQLARLSEAAALLHRGEAAQARVAVAKASTGRAAGSGGAPVGALGADAAGRDGRWAAKFLGARRNAAERRAALAALSVQGGSLGVVDAETLVEAALFGAPVDVRDTALRIAERYATQPTVANALLEFLPRAPRTAAAGRLYERAARASLPPVRDKNWPIAARRALVARLLESLDAGDGLSSIDEWAGVIADAYSGWSVTLSAASPRSTRAPSDATPDESAPESESAAPRAVALDPADAAAAALNDLRAEAAASGDAEAARRLRALDRRHGARRTLAEGGLQAFVAEQCGVVEALALLIAIQRPSAAAEANKIVERAEQERRTASVVEEQMESAQRAIVELWIVLLGEGGPA